MSLSIYTPTSCYSSFDSFKHCYPSAASILNGMSYFGCFSLSKANDLLPFIHSFLSDERSNKQNSNIQGRAIVHLILKNIENSYCHSLSVLSTSNLLSSALTVMQSFFGSLDLSAKQLGSPTSYLSTNHPEIVQSARSSFEDISQLQSVVEFITSPFRLNYYYKLLSPNQVHYQRISNVHSSNTLIHLAAASNQYSLLQHFLNEGHRINERDELGNTALHKAASRGSFEAAYLLLSLNCDRSVRNDSGYDYIDVAIQNGQLTFLQSLLKKQISINFVRAFVAAINEHQLDILRFLKMQNQVNLHQYTPLLKMSLMDYAETMQDQVILDILKNQVSTVI